MPRLRVTQPVTIKAATMTNLGMCGHLGGREQGHWPESREPGLCIDPRPLWVEDGPALRPALSSEAGAFDTRLPPAWVICCPAVFQKPGLEDSVASLWPQSPSWLIRAWNCLWLPCGLRTPLCFSGPQFPHLKIELTVTQP